MRLKLEKPKSLTCTAEKKMGKTRSVFNLTKLGDKKSKKQNSE